MSKFSHHKANVWWDGEGDFLEVTFDNAEGTMEPTNNKRVRVKVDDKGNVVGFHIVGVSKTAKERLFEIELVAREPNSVR